MSKNNSQRRFTCVRVLPAVVACAGMLSIGAVLMQAGCGPAPTTLGSSSTSSTWSPSLSVLATSQLGTGVDQFPTATLAAVVSNGTSPYTYAWTVNPTSGATISNATSATPTAGFTATGSYTFNVTVTDSANHTATGSTSFVEVPSLRVSVNRPAGADTHSIAEVEAVRNGDATLTATATGGIGAKTYVWTRSLYNGQYVGVNGDPVTPNAATTTVPTTVLGTTPYVVTVTDSASPPNTATEYALVVVTPLPMTVTASATPAALVLPATSILSCTITEGAPPYEYWWIQTGGEKPALLGYYPGMMNYYPGVMTDGSGQSIVATFPEVGTYTFRVTVVDSGHDYFLSSSFAFVPTQRVSSDVTVTVTSRDLAFTTSPLDNLVGTSGNDAFTGTNTTLQSSDQADGGAGNDTLTIGLAAAVNTTLPTLTSIETINISDASMQGSSFNAGKVSGLTALNILAASGAEAVTNLTSIPAVSVSNDASAVTLTFKDSAVSGSADALTVTLSNVTAGVYDIDNNASGVSSIETVSFVSTGAANTLASLAEGPAALNVSGDKSLTMTAPNSATTLSAAGMTAGGVVMTLGTGDVTFAGSPADDTVDDAGKYTTDDILSGGLGTDTLKLTQAEAAVATAQSNVTGFETLYITDGMTSDVTTSYWGTITTVKLPNGIDAAKTLSVPTGTTIELNESSTSTGAAVIQVPGSSTTDSVTVKIKEAFAMASTTDFSKIETVNVVADANATFTGAVTVNTAGSTRVLNLTGASGKTVTFGGAVTANVINGSALTGALTMSAATVAPLGAAISGGSGADVLYGSTSPDTISTGAGAANDVYAAAGDDLIILGTGVDTIHYVTTVDGMEIVQGFTAGPTGDIFKTNFGTTTGIASGKLTSTTAAAGAVTMATATYAIFAVTGTLQATITDYTNKAQVLAAISGTSVSLSAASNKAIIILYDGGNAYVYEATAPGGSANLATGTVTLVATLQGVAPGTLVDANFAP